MKRFGTRIILLGGFLGVLYWWHLQEAPVTHVETSVVSNTQETPLVNQAPEPYVPPGQQQPSESIDDPAMVIPDEEMIRSTPQMQASFRRLAEQYALTIKFPKYSMPLESNHWDLLHPFAFSSRPTFLDEAHRFSAEITLPRFLFFHGDPIDVTLKLKAHNHASFPPLESIFVEITDSTTSLATIPLSLQQQDTTQQIFHTQYQPPTDSDQWSRELFIRARIQFKGRPLMKHVALFRYVGSQVKLIEGGQAYVSGAHLQIPLVFEVKKAGRYRVRANVFNQKTQKPIAHLQHKKELTPPQDQMELRVHIATLLEKQDAGPYVLKDFHITRVPDTPGQPTEYGHSALEQLEIPSYDLNLYDHQKYHNPENQERLRLLKKLAGEGEE